MPFGLEVNGVLDNNLQINSEKSIVGFVPTVYETSSTVSDLYPLADSKIFVRYQVSSGNFAVLYIDNGTFTRQGSGPVAAEYIRLQNVKDVEYVNGEEYGLLIYNNAGDLAFDSRPYAPANVVFSSYFSAGSFGGNAALNSPITTDLSAFVSIPEDGRFYAVFSEYTYGLLISNNHSTYGTGIYHYGFVNSDFMGGGSNYLSNSYEIIVGEKIP